MWRLLLPGSLSGGTQRLVAIARAIVDDPEIIVFDEPTVGLDPPTARRLCEAAIGLRDLSNVTSMFVTHRLADVQLYLLIVAVRSDDGRIEVREENNLLCLIDTKSVLMKGGKVVFDGTDIQVMGGGKRLPAGLR